MRYIGNTPKLPKWGKWGQLYFSNKAETKKTKKSSPHQRAIFILSPKKRLPTGRQGFLVK